MHTHVTASNSYAAGHWHLIGRRVNVNVSLIMRKAPTPQGPLGDSRGRTDIGHNLAPSTPITKQMEVISQLRGTISQQNIT